VQIRLAGIILLAFQGAAVKRFYFVQPFQLLQSAAQYHADFGGCRRQPEGFTQAHFRVVEAKQFYQSHAEIFVRFGIRGQQRDRFLHRLQRIRGALLAP